MISFVRPVTDKNDIRLCKHMLYQEKEDHLQYKITDNIYWKIENRTLFVL